MSLGMFMELSHLQWSLAPTADQLTRGPEQATPATGTGSAHSEVLSKRVSLDTVSVFSHCIAHHKLSTPVNWVKCISGTVAQEREGCFVTLLLKISAINLPFDQEKSPIHSRLLLHPWKRKMNQQQVWMRHSMLPLQWWLLWQATKS